jgi:hypothetical protein
MPANKPLQRSGLDKVLGRGRGDAVLEQVLRARVLKGSRPAAERSCWAALVRAHGRFLLTACGAVQITIWPRRGYES